MKQAELSQRRKEQLASALKKRMEHKPLQKITIQELADDCGINRYTFYYHFRDVYDLLRWTFCQEVLPLLEREEGGWEEGVRQFLHYVRDNATVCRCAINSLGQDALRELLRRETRAGMRRYLLEQRGNCQTSEAYLNFLTGFYVEALTGAVLEWIQQDMALPEETLLRYLSLTLEGNARAAFQRAQREGV